MYKSLSDLIGNTPMLELTRLALPPGIRLFAKLEFLNPGGSIKDRMVQYVLDEAERTGSITKGATIVEATSGNTGFAIAMMASARGYSVKLTIPDKISREKRDALIALGAEIILCPSDAPLHSPEHYVNKARHLCENTIGCFTINQYDNPMNAEAHFHTTGPEIWSDMGGSVTAFVASGSTGGTISGIGRYLKSKNDSINIFLVDPIGSIFHSHFNGSDVKNAAGISSKIEGVGKEYIPLCMDFSVISDVIQFDDGDAISMCHELAAKEGLLCGGSSGANVWGCIEVARNLKAPANIVTVLPDSGIKYLSKIYNQAWLGEYTNLSRE